MTLSIFEQNLLYTAKACLPRAISNRLPLLVKPGDKIVYKGQGKQDFPRFGGDIQYSAPPETNLTCTGYLFGKVKEGKVVQTKNPFSQLFYKFQGLLIDNSTFEKPNWDGEESPEPKLFIPSDDELASDNLYASELECPDESLLREELGYIDADYIAFMEELSAQMELFNEKRKSVGGDTHDESEYWGTFEDDDGLFRMVEVEIPVGEDILMSRVLSLQAPRLDYYWQVEKKAAISL